MADGIPGGDRCALRHAEQREGLQIEPITNAHFNALTEDLYIAFDRVGVSYPLQNQMIALLAPMQRDIVKK